MNGSIPTLIARRSSHMSRVALLTAAEVGIEVKLQPLLDLLSESRDDYAGNPSLKVPVLTTAVDSHFGALNICRRLAALADHSGAIVWPEQLGTALLQNALEVVLNAMATEVHLIMARMASMQADQDSPLPANLKKARASLENSLLWLEANFASIHTALRSLAGLSYLEICLFCFLDHLEWRKVHRLDGLPQLQGFRDAFAQRPSAQSTSYSFDA